MLKSHLVDIALALHSNFDPIGQGIDHRNSHTMQAARKLVVVGAKLTAGMQFGHDNFDTTLPIFWVNIDWHTAAIVFNRQRTILIDNNTDFIGMSSQRLIHCIINDFLCQMVWARGIGIHAGTTTYRI